MKYKILNTIGKVYTPKAKEILESFGRVDYLNLTQDELKKEIKNYDVLIVGFGLSINKEIISQGKNLKIIATVTTGLDHIDVKYTESKGIKVISLRGENEFLNTITGTAELAFGLLINLTRYISVGFESVKNYQWNREKFKGHCLYGKTLGIAGLGRLGKRMAKYSDAFGMKVIAYDPYADKEVFFCAKAVKVNFNTLLKNSDIISIHMHLNEETENMFNAATFSKMKSDAYLINTARGKIVNEKDILNALENKKIAGYATDVLADELEFNKWFDNHPLVEYAKKNNNLIIVPHIGGMNYEARELTDIFIAKKVKRFLSH